MGNVDLDYLEWFGTEDSNRVSKCQSEHLQ